MDYLTQAIDLGRVTKSYRRAKPFAHIALPDFFSSECMNALLKRVEKLPFTYKKSDLFSFEQSADLKNTTDPLLKEFVQFLYSPGFMEFMRNMSGHKLTSTVDIAATRYTDTNYLLCHDDKLDSRKIAFLVYLTDMTPASGGALALYSAKNGKPHKVVERIFPQKGTFACFDVSAISYHEVEEVLGKHARVAIGGWYHVA